MDIPRLPRCKTDDEDMEKLHGAARKGNAELVSRVVSSGVSVSIANKFGCTALHLACRHPNVAVVRELAEERCNITGTWHGRTPLHLAVIYGNAELVTELLLLAEANEIDLNSYINEPDEYDTHVLGPLKFEEACCGFTALHFSLIFEKHDIFNLLVDRGASQASRDKSGKTPLMCCIELGDEQLLASALSKKPPINVQDRRGCTILHIALRLLKVGMAELIIEFAIREHSDSFSSFVTVEDETRSTPLLSLIELSEIKLLTIVLEHVDSFAFQQLRIHDSRTVLPERINWRIPAETQTQIHLTHDERRDATVRLLQAKLDDTNTDVTTTRSRRPLNASLTTTKK